VAMIGAIVSTALLGVVIESGLARAIRADEPEHGAFVYVQIELVNGMQAVKYFAAPDRRK